MAELTEHAQQLLRGRNFGFIATTMDDGWPHVSPVWVDTDDTHVLVNTAVGRVKERNVRRDPRVAISVANADNPYDKVDIRGRVVEIVEDDEAWAHIDALSRKYSGSDDPYPRCPGQQRILLRIEPVVVRDYSE